MINNLPHLNITGLLNEALDSNFKIGVKISESYFSTLETRELIGGGGGEQKRKNFTLSDKASDQGINETD